MSANTSIKLADGLKDRLKQVAQRKGTSVNALMNDALSHYLLREEAEEEFRLEAARRLEAYRATGLHVSHDEALDWLRRRAAGEQAAPPKPHR